MQETFQVHEMNFQPTPPPPSPVFTKPQGEASMKPKQGMFIILSVLVLLGGAATGFGLSKLNAKEAAHNSENVQRVATSNIKAGEVFGSKNADNYKDDAEGFLELGGIDGEGSHRLLREGGASRNVYLTSTSTDLNQFVGMKVKVWGRTFEGEKAGWLMDVGRVEVLEVDAKPPADAK